jgi:hypothetical protein
MTTVMIEMMRREKDKLVAVRHAEEKPLGDEDGRDVPQNGT